MGFSIYYTHTHSLGRMSERGESLSSEREREQPWRSYFLSLGFTTTIGAHSISEEVARFSPLWFPREKFFVSLVSFDFVVHVIISYKILDHIT